MFKKTPIFLFIVFLSFNTFSFAADTLIGKINFPTSMNEKAQSHFINGVLFLHNFAYEKARAEFEEAAKLDHTAAALAYWGEAMTYNHTLWDEADFVAGQRVLQKLGKTPEEQLAKASNSKEKLLIQAVQALYSKGDKTVRDFNYLKIMGDLYKKYPNDDEIASFYALALLGSTEGERDFAVYMRAGAIVQDVFSRNPNHPGAAHYAIHAYDDPIHAPLGLLYANQYSKIASKASHALHMPSHIYLALGMWDKVISGNKAAWAAANPTSYEVHDFHALQWIIYGYLQKKDYRNAFQYAKLMEKIAAKNSSAVAKWYYALMRAAYFAETKDWNADLKSYDMNAIELNARANNLYADSMIQLSKHPKFYLKNVLHHLEKLCQYIPNAKINHCGNKDYFSSITKSGIMTSKIVLLELRAQIAVFHNDYQGAIKFLHEAVKLEDAVPSGYGPPSPVKPANELLADVYLDFKNYKKAYVYYQKTLSRAPNRTLAVEGSNKALEFLEKQKNLFVQQTSIPYFHRLMQH